MPWVGLGPTIPAFERWKRVHALESATTVIGTIDIILILYFVWSDLKSSMLLLLETLLWLLSPVSLSACKENLQPFVYIYHYGKLMENSNLLVLHIRRRHFDDLFLIIVFNNVRYWPWPLRWSSGQSSWLQIQRSKVRFPALPNFLKSSGSGTGSTQPCEYNWGATWMEK
jgi:hypothetical protein